jgi:hypothetical protein
LRLHRKDGRSFRLCNCVDLDALDLASELDGGRLRIGIVSCTIRRALDASAPAHWFHCGGSDVADTLRMFDRECERAALIVAGAAACFYRQRSRPNRERGAA